jgi:hypothetical protein
MHFFYATAIYITYAFGEDLIIDHLFGSNQFLASEITYIGRRQNSAIPRDCDNARRRVHIALKVVSVWVIPAWACRPIRVHREVLVAAHSDRNT